MDEATKQALSEFVQKALAATEKAGEFAVEQAPLVVQEYITLGIVEGVFMASIGLLLVVAAIVLALRSLKAQPLSDTRFGFGMAAVIAAVPGLVHVVMGAHQALTIYVAPRVYIIEQLKGLL